MATRTPISKKLRFTVLQRDNFRCLYCGKGTDECRLEVDHVLPVSKGGKNDLFNLVTSCIECNRGKNTRLLTDKQEIDLTKDTLDNIMSEHKETKKYIASKLELINKDNEILGHVEEYISAYFPEFTLSDSGRVRLRMALKKYGIEKVYDAYDVMIEKHFLKEIDRSEQFDIMFNGMFKTLKYQELPPHQQQISYIIGLCRAKFPSLNIRKTGAECTKYYNSGFDLQILIDHLKNDEFDRLSDFFNYLNSCYEYEA